MQAGTCLLPRVNCDVAVTWRIPPPQTGRVSLEWRTKRGNDWDSRMRRGRKFQIRDIERRKARQPRLC